MTPSEVQSYLHEHIPLSAAMQVRVESASPEQVVLGAPLQPNINHRETVFGGSASALAILSAWTLIHLKLEEGGLETRLVIQRNSMHYEHPIEGYFTATAVSPAPERWQAFERALERRGRARIPVGSRLVAEGRQAGRFEGEFVAFCMDDNSGCTTQQSRNTP